MEFTPPAERSAPRPAARRTGRPPLTERRKAATRLDISRQAVRLFAAHGVAGTSADEIAAAAGLSTRTLWRYFPSKEECVRPLLTSGLEDIVERLRDWPPGATLTEALGLDADDADRTSDSAEVAQLVRLTGGEPGLRAVWLQIHSEAADAFAAILAEREGRDAADLAVRVRAGTLNVALRIAVEEWARHAGAPGAPALRDVMRAALGHAAAALPGE
ncbi:TetR/AcrR family transcriptional regulator [Streptomyces abyssomicinicus]|uniref:TetR/AcrR family transcriptional regulator n=1 Tax=Streptomyces abyssomicinicus TaxID=574929 RepID=UPI0012502249|nr:TetR/AcrR family transcriptional regulator [Streptomyces abyssomicinicus]